MEFRKRKLKWYSDCVVAEFQAVLTDGLPEALRNAVLPIANCYKTHQLPFANFVLFVFRGSVLSVIDVIFFDQVLVEIISKRLLLDIS
jgi:hypothetical protein